MTEAADLPARTHNHPPEPILDLAATLSPEILAATIAVLCQAQQKRTDELLAAHKRYKTKLKTVTVTDGGGKTSRQYEGIVDAELAGRATDFKNQIKAALADIDAKRAEFKRPVLDAAKAIDGSFKVSMLDPLTEIATALQADLTNYLRMQQEIEAEKQRVARVAEQARLRAEAEAQAAARKAAAEAEAARLAEVAAQAEREGDVLGAMEVESAAAEQRSLAQTIQAEPVAAPPPPVHAAPPAVVRSGAGSTLSGRRVWKWRLVNAELLPGAYRLPNGPMLDAALKTNPAIKTDGAQPVPGIEFYSELSAATR